MIIKELKYGVWNIRRLPIAQKKTAELQITNKETTKLQIPWNRGVMGTVYYTPLNLPKHIQFKNGHSIDYSYDALGVQRRVKYTTLKTTVNVELGSTSVASQPASNLMTMTTDYCGHIIYEDGKLKRILHPEGYLTKTTKYEYYYYLKDHLGNNRTVTKWSGSGYTPTSQAIVQATNYYPSGLPFGEQLYGGSSSPGIYSPGTQPYKFQGKEYEMMYGLNQYYQGARFFGSDLPMTPTQDPLAEKYYDISPYVQCLNNPVNYIDPDGRSTHTDSLGHVVAVYNNDDMGVYKHNISASSYDGSQLSADGGVRMGETEYWDEFSPLYAEPNADGSMGGFTIQFGKSFDPVIEKLHAESTNMNLQEIAAESGGGGKFDIKRQYVNTGGLLNGKYASSRSAGNYLAGYNASTGTFLGVGISFTTFQQLAGALHLAEIDKRMLTTTQKIGIVLFGGDLWSKYDSRYRAPMWGEIPYQYRMSKRGWDYGKKR